LHVVLNDASTGLSSLRTSVSQPLYVLLAMVGVLLAIACGNVAGLLLARAAGRAREMAIRQSIGAGRARLIRQMLAESVLLAAAAGLVGFTFAMWGRDALLALMVNVGSSGVPLDLNTGIDWRVLGFSLAISALTGIGCGVLPAIRGTRVPLAEAMKQDGRGAVGEGGRRSQLIGKSLVAAQMAFCLLLLVVAGLFTRSLRVLTQTDIGFDRAHVLTVRVDVRGAGYTSEERQALYRRVIDSLQAVPGVESTSMSANGPLWGSQRISSLSVEGYTAGRDEQLRTNEEMVTDRYFETMGLKILEGRSFRAEDRAPGARNTVVNQTMARRFFKGQSAIGRHWDYGDAINKDSAVIVGVVEDAKYVDLKGAPPNMAYRLVDTAPDEVLGDIEVKTSGSPAALATTVRETLSRAEPRLPIVEVVPLADRLARGVTQDRMVARLTAMFGALALLLACLGLYGTISYGISRRVAELGLRMALGADRSTVMRMVLREAMLLVVVGAAIGVPLAFMAARAMGTLLFNVRAADPISFLSGAAILLAVAVVAASLPAYRASRIEPMVALNR
jgi:predicted permease